MVGPMRSSPAALLSLVLAACGGAKPAPPAVETAVPAPSPPSAPPPETPEWEVAVKGADGKPAECAAAFAALRAEKSCKASLCAHAASLAKQWARYCAPAAEDAAIAAELGSRVGQAPTECGKRAEAVLAGGCERDPTCEGTASRWAAHCAKSDGSPLVLGLLERAVAKRSALTSYTLDARGCDELRAELRRGVACDPASCPAAFKTAQAHRTRCTGPNEVPDSTTALIEAAVFAAAGQLPPPPIVPPNPRKLTADDAPVLLPDRWGVVAAVCGARAADMAAYVANRRACRAGKVTIARFFVNSTKDFEVRAGAIDAPDDDTFARRFPSLRAVGEIEARDDAAKKALEAELPKAAALAKDPSTAAEAARRITRLAGEHGAALARSAAVRAAFTAVDADLAPALAEIGKAKLAAGKKVVLAAELAGLAARAPARPFADLDEDGAVKVGAPGAASLLLGASLFPRAMEAYTAALGDLAALAKKRPIPLGDARSIKTHAVEAAKGCAALARRVQANEKDLVGCAFTMNTCSAAKIEALSKMLDEDREALASARHQIDLARSVLPALAQREIEKPAAACAGP
jgi:hypothetical protein